MARSGRWDRDSNWNERLPWTGEQKRQFRLARLQTQGSPASSLRDDPGWTLPLELLRDLQKALQPRPDADPLRQRLDRLLGGFTGGLLTFYDAVPKPGQPGLLETDVLNPHYPRFYRAADRKVPSDDQNPVPVYFLAVKAETAFVFPFRLRPASGRRAAPDPGRAHETGLRLAGNRLEDLGSRRQDRRRLWLLPKLRFHSAPKRSKIGRTGAAVGSRAPQAQEKIVPEKKHAKPVVTFLHRGNGGERK